MESEEDDSLKTAFARSLLARAQEDLESSRTLWEKGKYADSCYHAQQSSEKAAKAVLALNSRFIKKHEISGIFYKLISELELEKDERVEKTSRYIEDLEPYWNIPRYPDIKGEEIWNPLKEYENKDAQEAVEKAEFVLHTIKNLLKEKYGLELRAE